MDKAWITLGKRRLCILLCVLMLPVCAAVRAEPVCFGGVTADTEAEYIDMGDEQIADWEAFYAFLRRLPHLRAVDLYETPIGRDRIVALNDAFPGVTFGMTMRIGIIWCGPTRPLSRHSTHRVRFRTATTISPCSATAPACTRWTWDITC